MFCTIYTLSHQKDGEWDEEDEAVNRRSRGVEVGEGRRRDRSVWNWNIGVLGEFGKKVNFVFWTSNLISLCPHGP